MFSRKDQLLTKTGPEGIGRYDYLRLLKKELCETNSDESKYQILANLANFSYDPINYEYIRSLNLIPLFLKELDSSNNNFKNLAIAAICNLSADSYNSRIIISERGIERLARLLVHSDENIILNVISTLAFIQKNAKEEFYEAPKSRHVIELIRNYTYIYESSNNRIRNLATIFLESQNVEKGFPFHKDT